MIAPLTKPLNILLLKVKYQFCGKLNSLLYWYLFLDPIFSSWGCLSLCVLIPPFLITLTLKQVFPLLIPLSIHSSLPSFFVFFWFCFVFYLLVLVGFSLNGYVISCRDCMVCLYIAFCFFYFFFVLWSYPLASLTAGLSFK